jgi:hypothetical protein
MNNRYDILINVNLDLLGNKQSHSEYYPHFIDENRDSLKYYEINPETIANEMLYNGLIDKNGENCTLTRKGIEIFNNGGWLKYLELLKEDRDTEQEIQFTREQIQDKISLLTAENLSYEKSKREQSEKIINLTEDNLRLQNWDIRFRWYIAIGTFILGLIIKHIIGK